jgi:holo-[acyl-carrier protein] synthase
VTRDQRGRPVPVLHGRAAEVAAELGVTEMMLSLSFTHENAIASAVAMTADGDQQKPEPTQRERLAASFKDARTILDDVEEEQAADE